MKNNKVVLLAVLVFGVWGTIAYKIFMHISDDDANGVTPKHIKLTDTSTQPEMYVLSLDYDDPFLKKKNNPIINTKRSSLRTVKLVPKPEVVINWQVLKYIGVVYNNTRSTRMASIRINENDYFLKEGEQADEFLILNIQTDSVKVGFGSSTTYIKREKTNN